MILKRRDITLIEILIAMTLTVLILTTLSFFYRSITMMGYDLDRIKTAQFYLRYVENRLVDVLPKALSKKSNPNDFVFYSFGSDGSDIMISGSQSLLFSFDNGVSLDKPFSNNVVGRLFVDPDGNLILAYWPIPYRWDKEGSIPVKKEVLLENVKNLSFEFFIAPEKKEDNQTPEAKPNATTSPEPKGSWTKEHWLKEYETLPALVKIHITMNNDSTRTYVYPLSNSDARIIYE